MKRKQILWTVIFSLSLVCCGLCVRYYDIKEIQSYEEQLEVVNYLNESYQKKLVSLMENKELLEAQLEQLIEEQTQLMTDFAIHENAEDKTWVFVYFKQIGEMVDSVGWIKYTQLMEYNAETKELY